MSHSKKMLESISEGDLAQASVHFNEALSKDLPEEKLQLADNLFQIGYLEEANELFKNLLEENPDEDALKISLAEIAIEEDKIEEAFTWLEQVSEESDVYAQSLLTTADIYQMLGIPEVSEAKLKEAKKLLPTEPLIDLALCELYFASESYSKAIEAYMDLNKDYPSFEAPIDTDERIGVALSRIGEYEEAIDFLEKSIEEKETKEKLFQLALCYYQVKENERSIAMLEKVMSMDDEFHQVYYPLAQILYDEGRHEEALQIAEAGIMKNPYETVLYHVASEAAYQLNQKDEARQYLEEVISLEMDSDLSKLKLAEFLVKEEEYEDIIEIISSLDNKEQGMAHWYLAQAHNGLEEFEKANEYYELAYPYMDIEADFLKDYGLFLREEGKLSEAKELLQKYLVEVPDDLMVVSLLENDRW